MSRVKLMLEAIDEVSAVADSLQGLAESLKTLVDAMGSDESPKEVKTETAKKTKSPSKTVLDPAPAPVEEKPPTLEEVRATLAEKSKSGKMEQVKGLLLKHGAERLSGIDPKEYKALLADAEVL